MHKKKKAPIHILILLLVTTFACDSKDMESGSPVAPEEEPTRSKSEKKEGVEKPQKGSLAAATMPLYQEEPKDPEEACGQVIVIAWRGAAHADDKIVRDKPSALSKAQEILQRTKTDPDFAGIAKQTSDASSSGPRGGFIGTYKRQEWPKIHLPIRDTIFGLKVNQIADKPVEAPYGYVVLRRCLVERIPTRHILIRYKGAKRAENDISRTKAEANLLAKKIYAMVATPNADFAKIAKAHSEDSSADRGGYIGSPSRGQLAAAFEEALFSMGPGEIRGVIETEFGFHIIQRMKKEEKN